MPVVKLSFSSRAWDYLAQTAASLGYCNDINTEYKPGYSTRGINYFFVSLSLLEYTDTRPVAMQGYGVWYDSDGTTQQHAIGLAPDVVDKLGEIAIRHMISARRVQAVMLLDLLPITPTIEQYIRWVSNASPPELAGAVLEAIGLRYLTPTTGFVEAPAGLYSRTTRAKWKSRHATGNPYERALYGL